MLRLGVKNILFIAPSFHKKTQSFSFLRNLLSKDCKVECYFVDLINEKHFAITDDIKKKSFDILVCFQYLPSVSVLRELSFSNGVIVPMFDACPSVFKTEKWIPYLNFNIISFSKKLHDDLKKIGLRSKYFQYFPPKHKISSWGDAKNIFFWNRRSEISINLIQKLFSNYKIEKLNWHFCPDPGQTPSPHKGNLTWHINKSEWFNDKNVLNKLVSDCAYFIAPRTKEGIGMSFIEAMASGRCVVAHDSPTMNEYITHGKTGLLYDIKKPKPLIINDLSRIQQNAYEFCKSGHDRWVKESNNILKWMCEQTYPNKKLFYFWIILRFFRNPLKTTRAILQKTKKPKQIN